MGGKPSAPTPPNPVDTARASTSTNVGTAISNAFLNNTNQITPEGSLQYDVTGNYTWHDPYTGLNVDIPTFTATQIRSPQQQAIEDQLNATKYGMAGLANASTQRMANLLGQSMNTSGAPAAGDPNAINNVPGAITEFGDAGDITRTYGPQDSFGADRQRIEQGLFDRLNPQLQRTRSDIEQRLDDQGIRYGSEAYTRAMDDWNRQSTDARLAVIAQGGQEQANLMQMANQQATFQNAAQSQAFQQAAARGEFTNAGLAQQLAQKQSVFNAMNTSRQNYMAELYAARNQPINEISALMSGSQINQPSFVNTPNNQIPTTDVAGLINNRFTQDMDIYKQESQNYNALMGGIMGMMGGMMKMSDERQKENIHRIGTVFTADVDDDEPRPGSILADEDRDEALPIYEYSYKGDPASARHVGPMAQDVEEIDPRAVRTINGIKYIDEARLGSILRAA